MVKTNCLMVLSAGGLLFLSSCRSLEQSPDKSQPALLPAKAQPETLPGEQAPDKTASQKEVEALERRLQELELALRKVEEEGAQGGSVESTLETSSAPSGRQADAKALLELLAKRDGAGLSRKLKPLLLSGKEGFAIIYEFLHETDVDREKILTLTHHPLLIHGLLRLVALHPEEVARLSEYLMDATADWPESFIRREIFNFLPVFLNHHKGRFPKLQERLEREIVYQIDHGGEYLYKVFLAMRDLDFHPPATLFLPLLNNPKRREEQAMILDYVSGQGEEGLEVTLHFVRESSDPRHPSIGYALKKIATIDEARKTRALAEFLEHSNTDIRRAATMVFFEFPRELDAMPRALDLLNSENATFNQKRVFVSILRQKNLEILQTLSNEQEEITSTQVRELVRQASASQPPKSPGSPSPAGHQGLPRDRNKDPRMNEK